MQLINSMCKEMFWKNVGESKKPKYHRVRKGRTEKTAKDSEEKDSMSPTSSDSNLSELSSSSCPLPALPVGSLHPSPETTAPALESLPSRPTFPVDKELHKAVDLPGLTLPALEMELPEVISDCEPDCMEEAFVPPSLMTHVRWPDPDLGMPAPVDFSFLLPTAKASASDFVMPANPAENSSSEGEGPGLADLSQFLDDCDQWADTFVEPNADEPIVPPHCEEVAFADTLVEEDEKLSLPASQAGTALLGCILDT